MKKESLSIKVTVSGALVELTGALLAQQGSCGILIDDQHLDTFEVPDNDLDVSKEYNITAFFEADLDVDRLLCELESAVSMLPVFDSAAVTFTVGPPTPEIDWAQNWRQYFSAFRIGRRLIIHPSWESPVVGASQVAVQIDPGMAFGTGTHATTRLCLEAIAEFIDHSTRPLQMLDVGTGSGILAIGAAALGCERVIGHDIDPLACEVAGDNVARNRLQDKILVTAEPLEQIAESFDLVVANILAEENIRLKDALIRRLLPGGWLVLSGILKEKESLVSGAFNTHELEHITTRSSEDWVCLVFRRQSP